MGSWIGLAAPLFLAVVFGLILLRLVANAWRHRADMRANLPGVSAAIVSIIALFVLMDWWQSQPFRFDGPIIVSVILTLIFLGRSHPSIPHSNS